jgi:hypothetical protein
MKHYTLASYEDTDTACKHADLSTKAQTENNVKAEHDKPALYTD